MLTTPPRIMIAPRVRIILPLTDAPDEIRSKRFRQRRT
jgi:hypothetical protein